MSRLPPGLTRTDTLFPYPTVLRAAGSRLRRLGDCQRWQRSLRRTRPRFFRAGRLWRGVESLKAVATVDYQTGIPGTMTIPTPAFVWTDRYKLGYERMDDTHLDFVEKVNALLVADDSTRSEEHTSELQSLMRISYAVFCLK